MFIDVQWQSDLRITFKPRRYELWQRLIEAMLASIAIRGYPATTVLDITKLAGVTRTQFYFLFQDKEDCFLTVQSAVLNEFEERLRRPAYAGLEWPDQVRLGVGALVEALVAEPAMARLIVVESAIAGRAARLQHDEALSRLFPLIDRGRELVPSRSLPESVAEMAVGSAQAMIARELHNSERPDFRSVAPDVYFAILMPYLGPTRALELTEAAYPAAVEL